MKSLMEPLTLMATLAIILVVGIDTVVPAQAQTTADKAKAGESKVVAHDIFGVVRAIKGSQLTIQVRTGQLIQVDATTAMQAHLSVVPVVSHAIEVRGTTDASGVLHAETILRAKDSPAMWAADR
jgi:Domain of unknown function (DUF5666)